MYFNSFKMKISVIFGVAQMLLGTFLKGVNAVYFRRPVEFVFVVLAQVLLMCCLFGFMNLLIVTKWTTDWYGLAAAAHQAHPDEPMKEAPGIINTMIMMFINGGVRPAGNNEFDVIDNQTWWMQRLTIGALISVPSMLLVLPVWEVRQHKKSAAREDGDGFQNADNHQESDFVQMTKPLLAREGDHDFSTVFTHSMIETIEYTLGCVSNTASYLRLWALSLAHS